MAEITSRRGYAFTFQGGTFTPNGKVEISDVESYNHAVEVTELAEWERRPERWHVYVVIDRETGGLRVTTWQGKVLGIVTRVTVYRNNHGDRMRTLRFTGTNGAEYYGRMGIDWTELCRVRKVKGTGEGARRA